MAGQLLGDAGAGLIMQKLVCGCLLLVDAGTIAAWWCRCLLLGSAGACGLVM